MNVQKTFAIADFAQLEIYANATNLLNAGTATAYYTMTGAGAYLDSLFGTPAGFVAPRRVNLGVKVMW